jgi:SSS family solute:Na+ symporter
LEACSYTWLSSIGLQNIFNNSFCMQTLDWLVLVGTLVFIIVYGVIKSWGSKNIEDYLLANQTMPWYVIGLSIMATQASAITFLSAPGLAYADGLRFVQFYFGMPLAMVVLCAFVVPIYHKLKVYTAYEYLEGRFDLKTRALAALLFLIQRGLAAGLTIYAPAIILSSILGWNIYLTNLLIGGLVIIYTVMGGTRAVSQTQKQQMAIILLGMVIAFVMIINMLPSDVSFGDAIQVAGKMNKLTAIDLEFDLDNRYNVWSGLIGGFFLSMSYFGTDQSQVGRYLSGKSIAQSRLGLLFNAVIKIPMQFFILLVGAMLFVFYLYVQPPLFFNETQIEKVKQSAYAPDYMLLEQAHADLFETRKQQANELIASMHTGNVAGEDEAVARLRETQAEATAIRKEAVALIKKSDATADVNDTNYIFLTFVTTFLPAGLVGLLIAVIFSASMSSTASELNALASTTVVDIYKRIFKKDETPNHYLAASKLITVLWGGYAIAVAMYASKLGNLLEAVNELGSLFYGAVLGIFSVAFFLKFIKGSVVFYAAIIAEIVVFLCYLFTDIAFLWFNVIGCFVVIIISLLWHFIVKQDKVKSVA